MNYRGVEYSEVRRKTGERSRSVGLRGASGWRLKRHEFTWNKHLGDDVYR